MTDLSRRNSAYERLENQRIDEQREVAGYLWHSPYHPETWPMETINRLVALRRRDERAFLLEVSAYLRARYAP